MSVNARIETTRGVINLELFADKAPLSATPTTLVLDRQGRVAARIIGELPEASILQAIVKTVLEEGE